MEARTLNTRARRQRIRPIGLSGQHFICERASRTESQASVLQVSTDRREGTDEERRWNRRTDVTSKQPRRAVSNEHRWVTVKSCELLFEVQRRRRSNGKVLGGRSELHKAKAHTAEQLPGAIRSPTSLSWTPIHFGLGPACIRLGPTTTRWYAAPYRPRAPPPPGRTVIRSPAHHEQGPTPRGNTHG
jgi:hypothetical protein